VTLTFIDRLVLAHYSVYANRPITGIFLHNTESAGALRVDQSQGSWHWLIDHDEDGTLYCDVSEEHAAWGVFATGHSAASIAKTKWRPPWLVRCPDDGVSDANYCAIHIELVSYQGYRDAGTPYTRGQYVTLASLIRDIFARRGVLPIVGHGQVQTDRSDPVAFDWDTFHRLLAETSEEEDDMAKLSDDQRAILSRMAGLNANSSSIDSWLSEIGAISEENGKLREEVRGLTDQLAQAPMQTERSIVSVAVNRKDGSVDMLN
jgi:N-acetyl-anhydromuramyl-L-alanine amidase AmpD